MDDILYGADYLEYYLSLIYFKYSENPLIIRICIIVVVLFIFAYFVLSVYILLGVICRKKDKKNTQMLYNKYYNTIVNIALDKNLLKLSDIIQQIGYNIEGKKKKNQKQLRKIAYMMSNIKGRYGKEINSPNFMNIQTAFDISHFLERELLFGSHSKKILALKFIQSLDSYVGEPILVRFLYHSNIKIRKSARNAYIWISQTNPFRFFEEDINMSLNQWDMIEMHDIINHRQKNDLLIPNLGKWATESIQEDVKVFFINEIKYLGSEDNCNVLQNMLNTQSWRLRNELINALGSLKCIKVEKKLIEIYNLQPEFIKQTIIESIFLIKSGDAESFFKFSYESAENQKIKLLSLYKLYNYSKKGKTIFEDLRGKVVNANEIILFEHVKCPFINNVVT